MNRPITTDSEILSQVFQKLASDQLVDHSRVTFGVLDGIVTLQGVVPSLWQKVESEDRVKQIPGVSAIANELIVELPTEHERDDADIVRAAAQVLSWHSDLPHTIQVTASNGWLTLSGRAQQRLQKDEAERAVRSITGVKGAVNDIEITM